MSFTIFQNKKTAFLGQKNKTFKKSKNLHFSKGFNPWFWSKNGQFFNFFFLGNIPQEDVFYDILERKTPFQAIKTKSSEGPKIAFFLKGLTHGFGPKMAIFLTFFLGKIGQENYFYDILERKNASLGNKNKKFKKSQNCHYSKQVQPSI